LADSPVENAGDSGLAQRLKFPARPPDEYAGFFALQHEARSAEDESDSEKSFIVTPLRIGDMQNCHRLGLGFSAMQWHIVHRVIGSSSRCRSPSWAFPP
jgi:hypothetical protein